MNEPSPLPAEFLARLAELIPADQLPSVLATFAQTKAVSFRVNTLRAEVGEVLSELQQIGIPFEPVRWLATAFTVPAEQRQQLVRSEAAEAGRIYIQNLSSMLAPWLLAAEPGEEVLDLAAAPGGKTIQIAADMRDRGRLAAVEAVKPRFFKLQANLTRCNVSIGKTYLADGRTIGSKTPERFDRVLLDAPCSSEARFRTDKPASFAKWSLRKIRESARKQVGLLRSAVAATQPGGRIVYCTCSFAPEENEAVISKVLEQTGGAVEVQAFELPEEVQTHSLAGVTEWQGKPFDASIDRCRRVLPAAAHDGFFLCVLEKTKSWTLGSGSGKLHSDRSAGDRRARRPRGKQKQRR